MSSKNIFTFIILMIFMNDKTNSFLPYTIHGKPCNSECILYKNKYYFCWGRRHSKGIEWDKCSPMNGLDINGNECKENHKCDFYGEKAQWCYLKKGGKGFCSNGDTNQKIKSLSSKGYYCINECKKYDNVSYTCETYDGDSWNNEIISLYCSPSDKVDYQDNECKIDHECDYHGKEFSWCYLKKGGWGYCSKNRASNDLGISYGGIFCKNECKRRDHDYFCLNNCGKFGNKSYSCQTLGGGWDYCGPNDQIDYRGNQCREDHKCDYYGEIYAWCYLKKGSWGYCSKSSAIEWKLNLKLDACSYNSDKANYTGFLYNYPKSLTAESICSILPVSQLGQEKIYAKDCYFEKNILIGKFVVSFGEKNLSNSS